MELDIQSTKHGCVGVEIIILFYNGIIETQYCK